MGVPFDPPPGTGGVLFRTWTQDVSDTAQDHEVRISSQDARITILEEGGGEGGDVVGPSSATDGHIVVFDGPTGKLIEDSGTALSALAPKASPVFTGNPTAPTASPGDNDTTIATTAFVAAAVSSGSVADGDKGDIVVSSSGAVWTIDNGAVTAAKVAADVATQAELDAVAAAKANLTSPAFTGNPTAPTPATSDNDTSIATTAFVQAALAAYISAQDVEVFKGVIDCSANPNYPAADAGHVYRVSVAGKIGGASGAVVEVNDRLMCLADSTASGNQAAVGSSWWITQGNIDGAVIGPASATDGHLAQFDGGTGKLIKGGTALDTDTGLAGNSDTRVATQKATKAYADAKVAQSITNGVTTSAPSQDQVFDALALKADTSSLGTAAAANTGTGAGNVPTITQADARYEKLRGPDSVTSSATPTINTDATDFFDITALATAITSMTTNLSGTPANGDTLTVRIKDNGTSRAIAWGSKYYEAAGVALPTATVVSKEMTLGFRYNSTRSKWGLVALINEA